MEELLKKYREYKDLLAKYRYALFILSFDCYTDCPKNDRAYSNDVMDFFEKKTLDITLSEDYVSLIDALHEKSADLDEVTRLDIEIEYKALARTRRVPKDELERHIVNAGKCALAWQTARQTLDYGPFYPELEELIAYYRKYIDWQKTDTLQGYDVLLDEMEEGYTAEMYDAFFDVVKKELVPFAKKILACPKPYPEKLDTLRFDIAKQKELTKKIAALMGYDDTVGCIRETAHPFTNWANNNDVRITTSYSETLLVSNLYSVMHEIGHALFQLQMDDRYNGTNIFDNVTCITHESQSRFYENYLGRSRAFVSYLYPVLCDLFPAEFEGITEDDLYAYVNSVQAQPYRTEADELTYPLHVLIRYEVEKKLFRGEIEVRGMRDVFDAGMKEYLGIVPENEREGVFQDVHWSESFGYFPTYAVGSAYGAMFYEAMRRDVDVDTALKNGDFKPINAWLREKIHRFSGTRRNLEVVRAVCGREFDPLVYVDYLKKKFSEIYHI